ncbi:toxin [Ilyomonas limi]|uniref:Toxin n=1 Tax=Ilyomonas limi TaxID=2575867 RepID=A0A4U3KT01_9BACT|nr:toxin [Ilyomonas limi]TKK65432.1 toxin [Ilyomonas limi]
MAAKEEVEAFLRQLRDKIRFFDVAYRPRDKNTNTLAELDILPFERTEYLKNLTVEDYYDGPKNDTYDFTKPDYYEFGVSIKGIEVYIKVSLGLPNKRVDCMSFHKAERPITYPYKKQTR